MTEAIGSVIPPTQAMVHKSDGSPSNITETQKVQNIMNEMQPIIFEEVYVKSIDKIKQMAS